MKINLTAEVGDLLSNVRAAINVAKATDQRVELQYERVTVNVYSSHEAQIEAEWQRNCANRVAEITRLANDEPGTGHEKDMRLDREKRGEESK